MLRKVWSHEKRQPWLVIGFSLFIVLFALFLIIMPPVWQLRTGPIEVVRWPKTGPKTYLVGPKTQHWVPIKTVSRHVLNAIVVSEDARFYEHAGLDWQEISNSIAINMEHGRYARGASTITQQVVKMAFLNPQKSLLRKSREAIGATCLEWFLDKDQILEWYINLVEFGDGVFGIDAAARHYFQTTPELLTIQDGAHLALVIPSPNGWSKGLRQRKLTEFGRQRYANIIDQMYRHGFITQTLRQSALATGDFGRPVYTFNEDEDESEEKVSEKPVAEGSEK